MLPAMFLLAGVAVVAYAYLGYPLLLMLGGIWRKRSVPSPGSDRWPPITITLPAYNEERSIGSTIERILELDYPADCRHVLVISDASTDRTDEIVRRYADRGVELLRLPQRGGKTAAENAARTHLRGGIIVNTDASVRIHPAALKTLLGAFADPEVGVASGRDVSVARPGDEATVAESGYVGYEMWIRDLETRLGGIVGASGCFYAIRTPLHLTLVPEALSRDFAAPLIAREQGYRSVSVRDALCAVPRSTSLREEHRRKVRTMTRGLETLYRMRHLMNPLRYGVFAWMLVSHKLVRWLVPWAAVIALGGLVGLAVNHGWARGVVAAVALAAAAAGLGWLWPAGRPVPRALSVPAYVAGGLAAGLRAWIKALSGELNPVWEPTRRDVVEGS